MIYKDFDETEAGKKLLATKAFNLHNINEKRIKEYVISEAGDLKYSFATSPVDDKIIDYFQELSDEQNLIEQYKSLLKGGVANVGEKRLVLHHLARGSVLNVSVYADNVEKGAFYEHELRKIEIFSENVRNGKILSSTGEVFEHVVQIGIGGSDLGPRALCQALSLLNVKKLHAHFISNVDPDDCAGVLSGLDLNRTLFILVTKSGTTLETLTNRDLVFKVMREHGIVEPQKHIVAVTSNSSPLANNSDFAGVFFIDDYIGGRYSSTSAVGAVILSLTYGFEVLKQLLEGAHEEDIKALEPNIRHNGILMDAMIGIYLRNIMNYPYTAVLPYSQQLKCFPAHLQQLDMESNGKQVNRDGKKIKYKTGPVVFGEPGTNGQHSFYQLLHQGTDIVPMQFIGFCSNQGALDAKISGSTSRMKLNANLVAQIVAFATGKTDNENLNRNFEGNRYSTLLFSNTLNPFTLGAILSHFENKIMFQGFVWNINSFDQEGVQLGKKLAKQVLDGGDGNENLVAYSSLLNIR